ncbi:lysine-specific demethylase JMJ30-like isoform X3 [Hordeum vulgare subsp. vulgare]|uniref:lysine-specific demethylase JMJ30-like isoform X3 n=1 Tax=Hordeum vulgare subsp. vulgare TaxID=112509 RepID=UPI001D1A39FE|nr:lysine-specific demethylase JMJ30-like isoform X3 [Hordeum vulgare subsp. vulgare]
MDTGEPTGAAVAAAGGEKRAMLLRQITEEGGFAFVASAEKAAAGDLRAAEAARDMAWEQLHSGPWSEVEPAWRHAYALACLHVASLGVGDDRRAALRALDMGLIMGGDLLRAELEAAMKLVAADGNRDGEGDGAGDAGRNVERWREGFSRNQDLGDVLKLLPVKSLSCKRIERRTCISLEAFIQDYFLRESPVILSGCIDHWPARTKWKDIKYLEKIAGDRTIPVEVGKSYVCNEWRQDLITFSQFLERMSSPDCSGNLTYLAQHPLFDQIKELREDIVVPEYCYAGGGELQSLNAWFGPHGTVTPLHHDPHHNLFAQVDLDNIDVKEFPRTEDLEFMDNILEEGDLLYIPPKWWHYMFSGSSSTNKMYLSHNTIQFAFKLLSNDINFITCNLCIISQFDGQNFILKYESAM